MSEPFVSNSTRGTCDSSARKPIEVVYREWSIPGQKVDLIVDARCWWN